MTLSEVSTHRFNSRILTRIEEEPEPAALELGHPADALVVISAVLLIRVNPVGGALGRRARREGGQPQYQYKGREMMHFYVI